GGAPHIELELLADIVTMLQTPRKASAADNRLRAACAEAVSTAIDVAAEVQERYAAVQAVDDLMPVLENQRRILATLLQLARDRLDAGEGTRADVTTLEAQRVALDVDINDKRLRQREDRLRLARLIGQPSSDAAWAVERWRPPSHVAADESAWIE